MRSLKALETNSRWLDYGCGQGALVKFCRKQGIQTVGFDEGIAPQKAEAAGVPILKRAALAGLAHRFDVVTAIEVLEHIVDPIDTLKTVYT